MAITSQEFIQRTIAHYNDRANWTYCHGSTGWIVGAPDNKAKNYYEYFLSIGKNTTNIPYAQWLTEHRGQKTTDCSNFINLMIFGEHCNSNWSTNSFTKMEKLTNPIPGAVAWKDGHVGVCIDVDKNGNGTYIHMPYYQRTFEKFTDNEDQWHPKSYWSAYYKLPAAYVNYSTAPVPPTPQPIVPTSILATMNGKYKVGTVLSAKDFTIKITMSDGSVLTNPPGWAATPLVLDKTSNVITVIYKNVKTTITVPAEAPVPAPTPVPTPTPQPKKYYRVQVGAYSVKANADKMLARVKADGFPGIIVQTAKFYKVQIGAYEIKANADKMLAAIKAKGYSGYITDQN